MIPEHERQKATDKILQYPDAKLGLGGLLYPNMPFHEYVELPGLNSSKLKTFLNTPLHYHHEHILNAVEEAPTVSMSMGTAVHELVLEGESNWVTEPAEMNGKKINKKSSIHRGWLKEWRDELPKGTNILSEKEEEHVMAMGNALVANELAMKWLPAPGEDLYREVVVEWNVGSQYRGAQDRMAKARLDHFRQDPETELVTMVDLKTAHDASPEGFGRAVYNNYFYHFQAAYYRSAVLAWLDNPDLIVEFVWVVVENQPPYATAVYECTTRGFETGDAEIGRALRNLDWCEKRNQWPSYNGNAEDPIELDPPKWYRLKGVHDLDLKEGKMTTLEIMNLDEVKEEKPPTATKKKRAHILSISYRVCVLRLPQGHILNPHAWDVTRNIKIGHSDILTGVHNVYEDKFIVSGSDQTSKREDVPVYEFLQYTGTDQLTVDTDKERLEDVVRREYQRAYRQAKRGTVRSLTWYQKPSE